MKDTKARFEAWWNGALTGLPLMYVVAKRPDAQPGPKAETPEALYTDMDYLTAAFEKWVQGRTFLADAYPSFSADLGPGSLALYLGTEPNFQWDTVWYHPSIEDLEAHPKLAFDADNRWWRRHLDMTRRAREVFAGRFRVDIPDLIENIDILAALHGAENTLFALMDTPELVVARIEEIDNAYFEYYDPLYDVVREPDGSSGYTAFHIQGEGRVAKIQCDFSAMLSPGQFREVVLPSLRKQVARLDRSLYHLDGPDAIRHIPAIMELEALDALQWTCGAGQPDGGCARWDGIYDEVARAGKSLWIELYDGGVTDWIAGAERLMNRYGKRIFYFIFPDMAEADAETLLRHAQKHWMN